LFADTQQVLPFVLTAMSNRANKPGYEQLCIFDSAELKAKQPENQTNTVYSRNNATMRRTATTS
jgi:hypothetical protein